MSDHQETVDCMMHNFCTARLGSQLRDLKPKIYRGIIFYDGDFL